MFGRYKGHGGGWGAERKASISCNNSTENRETVKLTSVQQYLGEMGTGATSPGARESGKGYMLTAGVTGAQMPPTS